VVHTRDEEGVGAAQKVCLIFPDDDGGRIS